MATEVTGPCKVLPAGREGSSPARAGPVLALWVGLVVALQAVAWLAGLRGAELAEAVERGAARIESRRIGEVPDDVIREAIRIQQDSLTFWATLAALGDFVAEPASLVVRAWLVASLLAGLAALGGRPVRFGDGLAACALAQGFWVLGLAVRLGLRLALGLPEIETSATLLLPPGPYPAATWVALRQLDAFTLLGWGVLALGGWRRGQASLLAAGAVCGMLWLGESALRVVLALSLGAGMRLTLIPEM